MQRPSDHMRFIGQFLIFSRLVHAEFSCTKFSSLSLLRDSASRTVFLKIFENFKIFYVDRTVFV